MYLSRAASFFYASPFWTDAIPKDRVDCMRSNYESFLVLILSLNAMLRDGLFPHRSDIPQGRLKQIRDCLLTTFPDDTSTIYFKHAFKAIAPIIKLGESLKELESG